MAQARFSGRNAADALGFSLFCQLQLLTLTRNVGSNVEIPASGLGVGKGGHFVTLGALRKTGVDFLSTTCCLPTQRCFVQVSGLIEKNYCARTDNSNFVAKII